MNILVTGSTGFVGSNLCRALLQQGHHVRAFHRPTSIPRMLNELEVEHALGDLTQPETLRAAVEGIEAVFHAAAWMGGRNQRSIASGRQYAVTVEGTRNLLQAARAAGVKRVVHTSSVAALGVPSQGSSRKGAPILINENHTWNFRPDWYPYGYAKYLAEQEVQKAVAQGLDVVIVNPSMIFGPGDIYRQSSSILNQVARRRVSVTLNGGVNVIHSDDMVTGHLAAWQHGRCGQRYILGGENLTFTAMLRMMSELTTVPAPQLVLPSGLLHLAAIPAQLLESFLNLPIGADVLHLAGYFFFYDISKAREDLGWEPRCTAQQAFKDAYAWFTSH